jgi:hypothetical protein
MAIPMATLHLPNASLTTPSINTIFVFHEKRDNYLG